MCCLIFLWNLSYLFRIFWWIESSKEQHLFEIEIFCGINVCTVTFDQFNASLLNKSINNNNNKNKNPTDPQTFKYNMYSGIRPSWNINGYSLKIIPILCLVSSNNISMFLTQSYISLEDLEYISSYEYKSSRNIVFSGAWQCLFTFIILKKKNKTKDTLPKFCFDSQ